MSPVTKARLRGLGWLIGAGIGCVVLSVLALRRSAEQAAK